MFVKFPNIYDKQGLRDFIWGASIPELLPPVSMLSMPDPIQDL